MSEYKASQQKYEREQKELWKALRHLFEEYKNRYGISVIEIAEGLGISRQLLHNFMSNPEENDLSKVNRANLLSLWAYVTDPKIYQGRKLRKEHRDARQVLRKLGPDHLLKTAGFLPTQENQNKISPKESQIKRVQERLSSNWIYDDALRAYLIDRILDQILDQGRIDREYYTSKLDFRDERQRKQIYEWPETERLSDTEITEDLVKKYRLQIRKLVRAGKTEFVKSELFELYQSILEHQILNQSSNARMIISDCQFRTISPELSLFQRFENEVELELSQGNSLKSYAIEAENDLYKNDEEVDYDSAEMEQEPDSALPRITNVRVTCTFVSKADNSEKRVYFENTSTATHIENMLRAVKLGIGYPLEISGFFIRATGRTEKSLARVSVGLSKEHEQTDSNVVDTVYQGWWVSSNTITGILKALGDAFARYLSNLSINEVRYYDLCHRIAEVKEKVRKITAYLYEGEATFSTQGNGIKGFSIDLLKEIESIKSEFKSELGEEYSKYHSATVSHLQDTVKLILVHGSLSEGRLEEIDPYIRDIESIVKKNVEFFSDDKERREKKDLPKWVIGLHGISALMRYKMISGDKEFIYGKPWLTVDTYQASTYQASTCVKTLQEYTQQIGSIDFDAYFCAAHFFGIIGQLAFYTPSLKHQQLEDAVGHLMKAAHYSYRIGHYRRSAQWIIIAARIYCRLSSPQYLDKAQKLIDLSDKIVKEMDGIKIPIKASINQSQDWLAINSSIAKGEIFLRSKNYFEAFKEFLVRALKIAYKVDYMRVVPDCLYNIHRASSGLKSEGFAGKVPTLNDPELEEKIKFFNTTAQPESIQSAVTEIISEYIRKSREHNEGDKDKPFDWEHLAKVSREKSAFIWNEWAKASNYKEHPFADIILTSDDFIGIVES